MIRKGNTNQLINVMQSGKANGNQELNEGLAKLVRNRQIVFSEALQKSLDKADLARRCNRRYVPTS